MRRNIFKLCNILILTLVLILKYKNIPVYGLINNEKNIGERISNIKVNGNPIENSQIYKICMNSYRASGAGGYDMYKNCKVIEKSKEEIFEIIVSYIEKLKHKKSWFCSRIIEKIVRLFCFKLIDFYVILVCVKGLF